MKKIIPLFTIYYLTILLLAASTPFFMGSAIAKPIRSNSTGYVCDNTKQERCRDRSSRADGFRSQPRSGGFQDPSMSISTVAEAKKMSDDQKVALKGYIIQSLGGKNYIFKDDTDTIEVEIDRKRWEGQFVTPNDLVEIQGEVDKSWKSIGIEVKRIIKVTTENNLENQAENSNGKTN